MKKLKPREWLLIAVPLLMMAAALLWQFRPKLTQVFSPRLYVENTRFVPVSPLEVSRGFDTKLEVVLNHGWPRPKWWTEFDGIGLHNTLKIYEANTDLPIKPVVNSLYWKPIYKQTQDRYIAHFLFCLSQVKNANALFLKENIAVKNGTTNVKLASLPFEYLVRKQNAKVSMPVVSRHTGLRVRRIFIAPMKKRMSLPGKIWMRVVYQREKTGKPQPNNFGAELGFQFLNNKGQNLAPYKVPTVGLSSQDRRDAFDEDSFDPAENDIGFKVSRADEFYSEDFGFDLPAHIQSTIFYEQKLSFKGLWPLQFKAEIWNDTIRKNFRAGRVSDASFTEIPMTPPV